VLVEAEGGEQFVGVREAAGQDVFFDRLRAGKYKGVDLAAAMAARRPDGDSPMSGTAGTVKGLRLRREAAEQGRESAAMERAYRDGVRDIVSAIRERPDIYPWKGGYKEVRRKGIVTERKTVVPGE
jgi:hypothetical protein